MLTRKNTIADTKRMAFPELINVFLAKEMLNDKSLAIVDCVTTQKVNWHGF